MNIYHEAVRQLESAPSAARYVMAVNLGNGLLCLEPNDGRRWLVAGKPRGQGAACLANAHGLHRLSCLPSRV